MSSELSFSSSVNEHDVISTSFKLWFLACDSLTLIVSYHRHTGFIRTLLMLARLKFSNLVLPTVSSWLIIRTDPFLGTISALFERKRPVGQSIHNNKRQLEGSSFSGVEGWSLADLQSGSRTANASPWRDLPDIHPPFCIPTGDQTPPGRSCRGPVCSSVACDTSPLSRSRRIFKIKVRNWLDRFWTSPWKDGRAGIGHLTPLRYRSLVPANGESSPCSSSNMQFLISSCKELCWLRVWVKTASNMPPLYFRVFCQPNCSWGVTLSLGIRPFVTVPCKELRED